MKILASVGLYKDNDGYRKTQARLIHQVSDSNKLTDKKGLFNVLVLTLDDAILTASIIHKSDCQKHFQYIST